MQAAEEAEVEDDARARPRDRELGRDRFRNRQIAFAAEFEGLQIELDLLAMLLPRAELYLSQIEAPHEPQGTAQAAALSPSGTSSAAVLRAGARAVTIRITATTMAAPATMVDQPMGSPRNAVPSATATTGFTNA